MRIVARLIVPLSMILLGGAVAPKVARGQGAARAPVPLDHRHQTGLALMPGLGYRVVVPYRDNLPCGDSSNDASKRVCTSAVPFFLDLQLSFGVSRRIDVVADLRFGIAEDPASKTNQFALAPGIRVWLDQDVQLKFYTTVQLLYDRTDYHGVVASNDFGIRNSNGLMYDVIRNVGFFFQFGESFGFRRWFRIELDAGLGVQVRFP
jgi:hypothetical protein